MSLQGLKAFKEQQETKAGSEFYKPAKGKTVTIRPLVELDEDSKNFSAKNGVAVFTKEYQNPEKFWLSVVDTMAEEGASYGAEMVKLHGWYKQKDADASKNQHSDPKKNWNPKQWVYIPVLVTDDEPEPHAEILRLSFYGDVATAMIDRFEASGSITDRNWLYKHNGADGLAARYSVVAMDADKFDVESVDVPDPEPYINRIPYADQAAFLQVASNSGTARSDVPSEGTTSDLSSDW